MNKGSGSSSLSPTPFPRAVNQLTGLSSFLCRHVLHDTEQGTFVYISLCESLNRSKKKVRMAHNLANQSRLSSTKLVVKIFLPRTRCYLGVRMDNNDRRDADQSNCGQSLSHRMTGLNQNPDLSDAFSSFPHCVSCSHLSFLVAPCSAMSSVWLSVHPWQDPPPQCDFWAAQAILINFRFWIIFLNFFHLQKIFSLSLFFAFLYFSWFP